MTATPRHRVRALQHHIDRYPKWLRLLSGSGLVFGGILGFLPVLGFWMIPLGLLVLSRDIHWIRRLRRRTQVRWSRRQRQSGRHRTQRGRIS